MIPSVTVAVFDDPAFVYTGGGVYDQSDSLQTSLRRLGHRVTTFTSVSLAASGSAPLLFPPFEAGDPTLTLPAATRSALQNFVARGGGMIVHAANNDVNRVARLLNIVFGYSVQAVYDSSDLFLRSAEASGTAFAEAPESLPRNNFTGALLTTWLPAGASSIYESTNGTTAVALFRYGSGRILFLGWNWADAVPLGQPACLPRYPARARATQPERSAG